MLEIELVEESGSIAEVSPRSPQFHAIFLNFIEKYPNLPPKRLNWRLALTRARFAKSAQICDDSVVMMQKYHMFE
ncbi:MAG: hypothetical protein ABJN22_00590 [Litorimonas sp.]